MNRGPAPRAPAVTLPAPAKPTNSGTFTIRVDHERDLVHATLAGFFSVAEVEAFARAQQEAVRRLACTPGRHRVLIDASQNQIHSQDVADAFARVVSSSPLKARRIAVVATGTLHRMQTRRILATDRGAMFATLDEAMAWLAADEAAVRAFG